jgi:hypothetical protein
MATAKPMRTTNLGQILEEIAVTENEELAKEIELLAINAEVDPDSGTDIKALAVGLWANFNALSVEEIEDALRDAWRTRGLPFNDNAGI